MVRRLILMFCLVLGLSMAARAQITRPATHPAMRLSAVDDPAAGFAVQGFEQTEPGIWKAHGATVRVGIESSPDGVRMTARVENGWEGRIERINFQMPTAWIGNGAERKIFSGYRGGVVKDWPTDAIDHGNANVWPGFCYSPIACVYNADGAGYALTAMNPQVDRILLHWAAYPGDEGRMDGQVRWFCNLRRGQTGECSMEWRRYAAGLPGAHLRYYRDRWLAPLMRKLGIPEGGFKATAPWSMGISADWKYQPGSLQKTIVRHKKMGSHGYVQWPPADGNGYFEPLPARLPSWMDFLAAKNIGGLEGLGVLVNPFYSPRLGRVQHWYPNAVAPQDINSPATRRFMEKLRAALKQRGINICYWDTGGNPKDFDGRDWLRLLKTWKADGVTLMAESSSDVAAWATGSGMIFAGSPNHPIIPHAVTPQAAVFYFDPQSDGWWDRMTQAKLVPLLTEKQLKMWATQHRGQN